MRSLARRSDWAARFEQFLWSSLSSPFAYGKHDCCLFVADAVLAMTGHDLAAGFRGRYSSLEEALGLCVEFSGKRAVAALVIKSLREQGLPRIKAVSAGRGDVALLDGYSGCALGIVGLSGRDVLAAAEDSYLRLPLRRVAAAWRV